MNRDSIYKVESSSVLFSQDGKMSTIIHKNGLMLKQHYHNNGNVASTELFYNNKKVCLFIYDENGCPLSEIRSKEYFKNTNEE